MKGNVIDMAVGVIIGGAFGKIVSPPFGRCDYTSYPGCWWAVSTLQT